MFPIDINIHVFVLMFGIWGGGGAIHVLIKVFYMCSGTIMHNHVVTCNSILLVWHALIQFMVISAAVVAHELYPGFIHFLRKKNQGLCVSQISIN